MLNKNHLSVITIVTVLIIILGVSTYMTLFSENKKDPTPISVIVSDSNSDRWISMKAGMEQAALDNDVELTFVTTDRITSITDEISFISKEIENGAHGIIFEPIASDGFEYVLADSKGSCAMVLLNSDVMPENVYATIQADNELMGQLVYEEVSARHKWDLDRKKIGIITGHASKQSMEERSYVLLSHEDLANQVEWTINVDAQTDKKMYNRAMDNPVDIIIALGSYETEKAIDYVLANDLAGSVEIYGVGYSEKAIYYLDLGTVTSLVLTNEFNQGYLSVEAACNQIKTGEITRNKVGDVLSVSRDNMYEDDTQKVLFPIVQ